MTQLRLLKVLVQPLFVVDDGEHLQEMVTEPVEVSAREWPTFATDRFEQLRTNAEVNLQDAGGSDYSSTSSFEAQ